MNYVNKPLEERQQKQIIIAYGNIFRKTLYRFELKIHELGEEPIKMVLLMLWF